MQAVQLAVRPEPATGQSFECWLNEQLSASGTGGLSFFKLTYRSPAWAEPDVLPFLIAHSQTITDPGAGSRMKDAELLNWTRNVHSLTAAVKIIVPGIRELTEPEQRNLRGIYRKLYRKA
jgi:hypothetical protein